MLDQKRTRDFWDKAAAGSTLENKLAVGMLTDGDEFNAIYRQDEEQKHFLKIFEPEEQMKVLEVGCGGGRWAFFLSSKVQKVVGLDFSSGMIQIANSHKHAHGITNVDFFETDLVGYITNEKYDLIYFSGVLQYLDDESLCNNIKKAQELLVDGGLIISRDTVNSNERRVLTSDYPVVYRTISEYKNIFSRFNYSLVYCEDSFKKRRFSFFSSKLYRKYKLGFKLVFAIQSLLIVIDNVLGNPRFLMKSEYKKMVDSGLNLSHKFFVYRKKN